MNVTEVLQLMQTLFYKHSEKEFEDLHKEIIKGILEYKTYREIAEGINYDPEYVGTVSRELYEVLSQELRELGQNEEVKKANFVTSVEKIVNSSNLLQSHIINNSHINLYSNNTHNYSKKNLGNSTLTGNSYHELTLAPQIINFYNREKELEILSSWIKQNTRLISILGISGTGKTTLVKRFLDLNLELFPVIIWKSLKFPKPLELVIPDLLNICQQQAKETFDDQLKQLFDIMTEQKCLIILDDVQNIFTNGELAGQYETEYKNYQKLFNLVTQTHHQSHVILISQEQCPEMECLDEELYPMQCLEILGLSDVIILQNMGLKNPESWSSLVDLYEGNLLYLRSISILIQKNYDGQVADFLAENILQITNQIQIHFREIFDRMSLEEQAIVLELSKSPQPIDRENLRQNLDLSSIQFNNGLKSLQQRYLVKKIKEDKVLFSLSPIFQEYVKIFMVKQV